jgi:hypothetical protein
LQQEPKFGCGNFSVVGPVKGKLGVFGHVCLFCGSYRCDRCRNPKLKKLRSNICRIASEKKLNKFATLTLDRSRIPVGWRSDQYIRECWRKMRVYLFRKFGNSLDYIGVLEFHKSEIAHMHLLLAQWVDQEWLSDAWAAVGGGVIVDIRGADIHRVSAYLSVYLTGAKIKHTLELLVARARIFTTFARFVSGRKKKSAAGGYGA